MLRTTAEQVTTGRTPLDCAHSGHAGVLAARLVGRACVIAWAIEEQ
jgi:hypothetical protein